MRISAYEFALRYGLTPRDEWGFMLAHNMLAPSEAVEKLYSDFENLKRENEQLKQIIKDREERKCHTSISTEEKN